MEIEAKFSVPNATVLARLDALHHLANFSVLPGKVKKLRDCYLDTDDRQILAHGYALRRRQQDDGDWIMSLKRLAHPEGAIYRREEMETKLMPQLTQQAPSAWQQSDVYAQLRQMLGDATLNILFCLSQTRTTHRLADSERIVAHLSLDEVHLNVNNTDTTFFELEAELTEAGTEADLREIVAFLQNTYFLSPERRAKFERALTQLDAPATTHRILSPAERTVLTRITTVNADTSTYGRRAKALLALDEGISGAAAATRANLSERQVRHWRSKFSKHGASIFPARILEKAIHAAPPPTMPIAPTDPIAVATRKLLWQQLQQLNYFELEARLGNRLSSVEAMLLATRRFATAVDTTEQQFPSNLLPDTAPLKTLATHLDELHATMTLQQHAEAFLTGSNALSFDELRTAWHTRRQRQQNALNAYFDSAPYRQWLEDFSGIVQVTAETTAPSSTAARWYVPAYLYQNLAGALAADPTTAPPTPTALKPIIDRLGAYGDCIALFKGILGSSTTNRLAKPVNTVIAPLDTLYQRLTTAEGLRRYLDSGNWDAPADPQSAASSPADTAAISAYAATVKAEIVQLQADVAAQWAVFVAEKYWHTVANAVKRL